ncbi:hypothetical protein MMPV_006997 [Pyropia vietnamensis]
MTGSSSLPPPRLFLLRHGQSLPNVAGRVVSRLPAGAAADAGLTATGVRQSRAAAGRLLAALWPADADVGSALAPSPAPNAEAAAAASSASTRGSPPPPTPPSTPPPTLSAPPLPRVHIRVVASPFSRTIETAVELARGLLGVPPAGGDVLPPPLPPPPTAADAGNTSGGGATRCGKGAGDVERAAAATCNSVGGDGVNGGIVFRGHDMDGGGVGSDGGGVGSDGGGVGSDGGGVGSDGGGVGEGDRKEVVDRNGGGGSGHGWRHGEGVTVTIRADGWLVERDFGVHEGACPAAAAYAAVWTADAASAAAGEGLDQEGGGGGEGGGGSAMKGVEAPAAVAARMRAAVVAAMTDAWPPTSRDAGKDRGVGGGGGQGGDGRHNDCAGDGGDGVAGGSCGGDGGGWLELAILATAWGGAPPASHRSAVAHLGNAELRELLPLPVGKG